MAGFSAGIAAAGPELIDLHPQPADMRALVLEGMARRPRQLPAWLLYDQEGSRLFEAICEQPEYSLTRTEVALLEHQGSAIAAAIRQACGAPPAPGRRAQAAVVEFGAGNARKASPLLAALAPPAYVALDISRSALASTCAQLQKQHPHTQVLGVCCDYGDASSLPPIAALAGRPLVGFYPGSSIGNFDRLEARQLLGRFRQLLGPGGLLLIGVDQPKPVEQLEAAYNDAAGVSAAFAFNLLARLNRDLEGDFQPGSFSYRAHWQPEHSRIAMALVSRCDQTVALAGQSWAFRAGEELVTEYSVKYSPAAFEALAREAGWRPLGRWSAGSGEAGQSGAGDLSLHLLAQADCP
jgi:dimethylhistidine N-methyltransferase